MHRDDDKWSREAVALSKALMSRKSVTPDDAECQDLVARRLRQAGFSSHWIRRNGFTNLWARRGTGRPLFCFVGHTDVVPPGPAEKWTNPPFRPVERAGMLYGRGAADMKTAVAAFVTAARKFVGRHPEHRGSIAVLLTSGEEVTTPDGAECVVEWLKQRRVKMDYCIVGEPTSSSNLGDTIKNGRRGSFSGSLAVRGVQGHIAYANLVRNPVHIAAPAIRELVATRWDNGNRDFPPTTMQISNVHAGIGVCNVTPPEMRIDFNFRFSTASNPGKLKKKVCAILDRHGLDYRVKWELAARPYLSSRGPLLEALSGAIAEVAGKRPAVSTAGGTSDGRFIAGICPEVLEFGLCGNSSHRIDECVRVSDITGLAAIYCRVLEKLLA